MFYLVNSNSGIFVCFFTNVTEYYNSLQSQSNSFMFSTSKGNQPNTLNDKQKTRKVTIMAPRKKQIKSPIVVDDAVELNTVLPIVVNLLRVMSPGYSGYPTETLANKLSEFNWDLNKHEILYLLTAIKAVSDLAFTLRLNDASHLIKEVESKVQLAQAKASIQDVTVSINDSNSNPSLS